MLCYIKIHWSVVLCLGCRKLDCCSYINHEEKINRKITFLELIRELKATKYLEIQEETRTPEDCPMCSRASEENGDVIQADRKDSMVFLNC